MATGWLVRTLATKKPGFYPPLPATTIRRQAPSFSSVFPRGSGLAADAASATSPKAATSAYAAGDSVERPNTSLLNGHAHPASSALTDTSNRAAQATAAAANQALEKLAAGLAEGAAPPIVTSPQPSAAPIHSSPPPAPAATQASAPAVAPASSAGPRTLDDMVSDLLRPMLEKWVESNMPRLMEKALRPGPAKDPNLPKS